MKEKIFKYLIIIAGTALGLFLFPFVWGAFAPFLLAFAVAHPCQQIIRFFDRRFGISRGVSSAAISTLIVTIVLSGVVMLGFTLYGQVKNLAAEIPQIVGTVNDLIQRTGNAFERFRQGMPNDVAGVMDNLMLKTTDYVGVLSGKATDFALSSATHFAAGLPQALFFFFTLIISVFFFVKDHPLIINFLKDVIPQSWQDKLLQIGNFLGRAFSLYLKAQLYLMLITWGIVTICFWIAGLGNPLLWGLLCAAVDALPFLGTAVILLPWAVAALLFGDMYTFTVLIITQLLVFIVRQLAEPRIVSRQIGLHPILTLVSVYIGLKFFGVVGVLLAPIACVFAVNLYVSWREGKTTKNIPKNGL